jgi:hypothetical protein
VPDDETSAVRPTKRCLDDLGIAFPPVNQPLQTIDHPLINKAQHLPAEVNAGGAERIKALSDRVWFKVKVVNLRGAAIHITPADTADADVLAGADAWWWLCAAGERKEDSSSDFYKAIEAEAARQRSASKAHESVNSTHLLPQDIDYTRLRAESLLRVQLALQDGVRRLIYRSIKTGKIWEAEYERHTIKACVRAEDEAYVAIATEGFLDPRLIAVILAAVPGVASGDWQPEPGGVMGVEPAYGQIVYSAMISPQTQISCSGRVRRGRSGVTEPASGCQRR